MWRFWGGMAVGATIGALASALIPASQTALSDGGALAPAPHILHQLTRLDRLESDQLAPPGAKKPHAHAQAAAAGTPIHHKEARASAGSHGAAIHETKSVAADRRVANDPRDVNEAVLPSAQSPNTASRDTAASSPPSEEVTTRGIR